jgi:hypothetical protein
MAMQVSPDTPDNTRTNIGQTRTDKDTPLRGVRCPDCPAFILLAPIYREDAGPYPLCICEHCATGRTGALATDEPADE